MTAHKHRFVPSDPYRVCEICQCVQRKIAGRWVQGSLAANPTERKNIARRVLGGAPFEGRARFGSDPGGFTRV